MKFKNEINTKEIKHIRAYIADDNKAIDVENRRINFVVSSEVVDRSDEIVEAAAVADAISRKGEFIDNPICLACHLHRLDNGAPPAVGSWDTATAAVKGRKGKKQVEMVLQFDTEYDLGEKYWIVYKNKTMRAVSIGFRVLSYRVEDRDGKRIFIVERLELIEISCVAVGANQQALAKLKEMGLWEEQQKDNDGLAAAITAAVLEKLEPRFETIEQSLDELITLQIPGAEDDLSVPVGEIPLAADETKSGPSLASRIKQTIHSSKD